MPQQARPNADFIKSGKDAFAKTRDNRIDQLSGNLESDIDYDRKNPRENAQFWKDVRKSNRGYDAEKVGQEAGKRMGMSSDKADEYGKKQRANSTGGRKFAPAKISAAQAAKAMAGKAPASPMRKLLKIK